MLQFVLSNEPFQVLVILDHVLYNNTDKSLSPKNIWVALYFKEFAIQLPLTRTVY